MPQKIAISDSNILIDFCDIGLIEQLVEINMELYTTDFVINEIEDVKQFHKIDQLVKTGKLKVIHFTISGMNMIFEKENATKGLSLADCSVWHLAETKKTILLTGDGKLRKTAKKHGIVVHGSLWVLDQLLGQKVISKHQACQGIQDLMRLNPRLPVFECEKRRKAWCQG